MNKPTILVLCTGNSCRSHLAEGILQQALGKDYNVQSAGSKPAGYVHPLAVKVMRELGIDISGHRSKHLEEFLDLGSTWHIYTGSHMSNSARHFIDEHWR